MNMKYVILVIFALLSNIGKSQKLYSPIVKETHKWFYYQLYDRESGKISSGHVISLKGDTIINDIVYKKVNSFQLAGSHSCPPDQRPCFSFDFPYKIIYKSIEGFIREDTTSKQVFFLPNRMNYCKTEEFILFDFSLKVGDSISSCNAKAVIAYNPMKLGLALVDSIGKEFIHNKMRKTIYTTGGFWVVNKIKISQGVGFEKYGLFHGFFKNQYLHEFCEGSLEDCNIINYVHEYVSNSDIKLFPNPVYGHVVISSPILIKKVEVYSTFGIQLATFRSELSYDFSIFSKGILVLKITLENDELFIKKILKI